MKYRSLFFIVLVCGQLHAADKSIAIPTKPDDIPLGFLTRRLLGRAPLLRYAKEYREAILETYDQLHQWMSWAQTKPSLATVEQGIINRRNQFHTKDDLVFHLYHIETHEVVGAIGLHRINWEVPKVEIGYWIRKKYQGQGLMTEAVKGITKYAFKFLGAKRVEIRVNEKNEASVKIPERLKFTLEGRLVNDDRAPDGSLRTTLVYAKTK